MKFSRVVLSAGFIGGLALGVARPAHAQVDLLRPTNGPVLTKSDFVLGNEAATKLLEGPPDIGYYQDWHNPKTGNGGTLTILDVSTSPEGLPCRKVESDVKYYKKTSSTKVYSLNVCKQSDGSWKLLS
jgi:surface antigen